MAQDIKTVQDIDRVADPSEGSTSALVSPSAVSSDSPVDAVSSLRALALSTMRSKRRKGSIGSQSVPSKPLPTRPAAVSSDIDMLDYGSEEAQKAQDTPDSSTLADKNMSIHKQVAENAMDAEEEVREEGEISDEDMQASPDSSSITPVNGTMPVAKPLSQTPISPQPVTPLSSLFSSVSNHSTARSNLGEQSSATVYDQGAWNHWVPEPDHVRPGLKMNMEQFNLVKELVLDLLGWGVSPEYLVDCGLTREAVFYTFTELNLRLPKNLDVAGLSPFPPPIVVAPKSPLQTDGNSAMPPPPSIPHRVEAPSVHARRPSLGHPLPAKPIVGEIPTSPTVSTISNPVSNTNGHNLSDMEAQRRQELQARKAVLATRKKKGASSASTEQGTSSALPVPHSTAVHGPGTVDAPIPVIPTEAVDDFLKSMLESAAPPPSPAPHPTRLRALSGGVALGVNQTSVSPVSPDGMDIDADDIPGLGSYQTQKRHESLRSSSSKSPSPRDTAFAASTSTIMEAQITRSPSVSGGMQPPSMPSTPTLSIISDSRCSNDHIVTSNGVHPSGHAVNGKRGSKRPVAMDFVDVDHNLTGTTRTAAYAIPAHPPYVRRKMGSFAGLGANISRRCVIDVSDSEEDEPGGKKRGGEDRTQTQSVSRADSNTPGVRPVYVRPTTTLPGSIPSKPASPGVLTPETLMEKEKQIQRMKELIAQRELGRLKKLAEKSRTPVETPPPSSGSTSVQGESHTTSTELAVTVKVEEVDNAPLSTSTIHEAKSQVAPSRSESGSTCDQADEDAVIQDLTEPGLMAESALSTPTVIKKNALEHYSTGESVLTAEAREEQVQSPSLRQKQAVSEDAVSAMPVDVDPNASSAKIIDMQRQGLSMFTTYTSPFHSYPLLRSRSRVVADLTSEAHLPSSFTFSSRSPPPIALSDSSAVSASQKALIPDLRPLRVAVMLREMGNNFQRRVCQYEVPGGGECRDKTCTDVHLNDLEPDDHETARYLIETMPNILQTYNESEVVDQLLQARQKRAAYSKTTNQDLGSSTLSCSLEATVAEAVAALVGDGR